MTAHLVPREADASSEEKHATFIFARHGQSVANVERVVSSDPAHGAGLTPRGRTQARQLGALEFPRSGEPVELHAAMPTDYRKSSCATKP